MRDASPLVKMIVGSQLQCLPTAPGSRYAMLVPARLLSLTAAAFRGKALIRLSLPGWP